MEKEVIEKRFKLIKKIGEGAFGKVYVAKDLQRKQNVAVKFEIFQNHLQLTNEILAYTTLANIEGIPRIHFSGVYKNSQCLVMDLLGETLQSKIQATKTHTFSLNTVTLIGLQLVKRLEDIHNLNFLHRDIKPANIAIGENNESNTLFLFDFGLCKKYRDPKTKQHTLYREGLQLIGNYRYASLNTRFGIEQSRRDDLEALFYMLLDCYKGFLPWEKKSHRTKFLQNSLIKELTIDQICQNCPNEFTEILKYIRNVRFEEKPDYEYIRGLFSRVLRENFFGLSFDWVFVRRREGIRSSSIMNKLKVQSIRADNSVSFIKKSFLNSENHYSRMYLDDSVESYENCEGVNFLSISRTPDCEFTRTLRREDTIKDNLYPEILDKSILLNND